MVKNQYEGYEYIDPNHQYTYPNSTVLINKQNITNIEEAYRNEHLFVTKRLADLRLKTIEVYSISDILAIHKYLFQDVYAWAGQFRKVNISKNGNPFMLIQSFSTTRYFVNQINFSSQFSALTMQPNEEILQITEPINKAEFFSK